MQIRVLSARDVRQALPMAEAVEAMKAAYGQFSAGRADVPLRTRVASPRAEGVTLFMPASLFDSGDLAVKTVSVFPRNQQQGLPTIHALVVVLSSDTGAPLAVLEGAALTALRTGAAAGAATDLLAPPGARSMAVFGSGVQARTQLEAVCTVRPIERAWVYSLDTGGAQAMVDELRGQGPIPQDLSLAGSPSEAAAEAEVICTATTSLTPVFAFQDIHSGVHINAVGSYTPEMQEIDSETVAHALVVVDSREAVLAETGDLLIPLREGTIRESHLHAELGEIINGDKPGRTAAGQLTLFKSVGLAVQDAVAAGRALARAEELGLGKLVEL